MATRAMRLFDWVVKGFPKSKMARTLQEGAEEWAYSNEKISSDEIEERRESRTPQPHIADVLDASKDPLRGLWSTMEENGGGFYQGMDHAGIVQASPVENTLVNGVSQSGKSSRVGVPAAIAHPHGLMYSTIKSEHLKVLAPVRNILAEGPCLQYSPTGESLEPGLVQARWNPFDECKTWDTSVTIMRLIYESGRDGVSQDSSSPMWRQQAIMTGASLCFALGHPELGFDLDWVVTQVYSMEFDGLSDLTEAMMRKGYKMEAAPLVGLTLMARETATGILANLGGALEWLMSDSVRESMRNPNLKLDDLVDSKTTLFLYTSEQNQNIAAPLVSVLIVATRWAAVRRFNRYEEKHTAAEQMPFGFIFDEFANMVRLPDITTHLALGRQLYTTMALIQDPAQLYRRWGKEGGEELLTSFQHHLIFPGSTNRQYIATISELAGEGTRWSFNEQHGGRREERSNTATPENRQLLPPHVISSGHPSVPNALLHIPAGGGRHSWIYSTAYYEDSPWPRIMKKAKK